MSEVINNQSQKMETLKAMIRQLHQGKSVDEVKAEFAAMLQDVGAGEIAQIEQALIAEGLPVSEVQRLCDVHVAVFRESLDAQPPPESTSGHPIHTFRAENEAAGAILSELLAAIHAADWERARHYMARLQMLDRHYLRKENLLFPYLEKHGFTGPTAVMWGVHDEIRSHCGQLADLLLTAPGDDPEDTKRRARDAFEPVGRTIRDMFYKEETILFPAAIERLSEQEWAAIRAQEDEFGFAFVQPGNEWQPQPVEGEAAPVAPAAEPPKGALPLKTGALTLAQINWLFNHLPVDITFVDQDDTVRFFSETAERIFPRTESVIGRKVQACHPPHSVDRVQRILDDFRAGARDTAEFWIQMGDKFIHIRYFAIRDERGAYQGTIEVTQDITHIRELEGERRLLDD
jgi:uncharacterized protein